MQQLLNLIYLKSNKNELLISIKVLNLFRSILIINQLWKNTINLLIDDHVKKKVWWTNTNCIHYFVNIILLQFCNISVYKCRKNSSQ